LACRSKASQPLGDKLQNTGLRKRFDILKLHPNPVARLGWLRPDDPAFD
jgi:hypothetical protein